MNRVWNLFWAFNKFFNLGVRQMLQIRGEYFLKMLLPLAVIGESDIYDEFRYNRNCLYSETGVAHDASFQIFLLNRWLDRSLWQRTRGASPNCGGRTTERLAS